MVLFWKWCLTVVMYLVNSLVPHSILRQPFQRRKHNNTSKSVRTATWSMADFLSSIGLLASNQIQT